ncbi:hypothetical protein [Kribbella kalugense]|uniref:hypothetical protein n=1 Tax=Kribbella kalugense TaxID=2512221 RepID=UPI001064E21B|nr:hypothetical protein [Kribbella kalugense]
MAFDRDQRVREKRQPVYQEFRDAANEYLTAEAERLACAEAKKPTCGTTAGELQHARYRTQVAINNIHVFGTPAARDAMRAVMRTVPATLVGPSGDPILAPVDAAAFDVAIAAFDNVTCRDVSPAPEDC